VDIREKRQLELASQMAHVRARTRPWRSIIALVLAMAAGATSATFRHGFGGWTQPGHLTEKAVTAAAAAGFCVFAVIATLGLSGKTRDVLRPITGSPHAAVIRYSIVLIGSAVILVITLDLLKVPIGQLIVGGALTTILIGIAAQQSLGNVFAGIVLLLSRPFAVGDLIQLRSGSLGGLIEGTVTEIGITYMRLDTRDGLLCLPNSQVLAAGVGPVRPEPASDGNVPLP
jgi:small-conductance mechanosensitive channel